MADGFAGFPERMTYVPVPGPFFGPLLQAIDDLAELKVALHVFRRLHELRGDPRYVRRSELLADGGLLAAIRDGARAPAASSGPALASSGSAAPSGSAASSPVEGSRLPAALDAAVRRGVLLAVAVYDGQDGDVCYLLNTPPNARVAAAVARGERTLGPLGPAHAPTEAGPSREARPSIFELYEQNVGLLTPLIAEELREAEATYPAAWVEDAFREAVALNRRSWRYILRILENWAARGRGTRGTTGRRPDPAEDPRQYLEGEFGRLVRRRVPD